MSRWMRLPTLRISGVVAAVNSAVSGARRARISRTTMIMLVMVLLAREQGLHLDLVDGVAGPGARSVPASACVVKDVPVFRNSVSGDAPTNACLPRRNKNRWQPG